MDYQSVIMTLQRIIPDVPKTELPLLLGELERLKAVIWADVMNGNKSVSDNKLLSIQEVASQLNIPPSKVYDLVRQGKLQGVRLGKYVRVKPSALEQYQAWLVTA